MMTSPVKDVMRMLKGGAKEMIRVFRWQSCREHSYCRDHESQGSHPKDRNN